MMIPKRPCVDIKFNYNNEKGSDGQVYPNSTNSSYILPFPVGTSFKIGLTNCSSSYHGAQYPDRYTFDFDMAEGTGFYASWGGIVEINLKKE